MSQVGSARLASRPARLVLVFIQARALFYELSDRADKPLSLMATFSREPHSGQFPNVDVGGLVAVDDLAWV